MNETAHVRTVWPLLYVSDLERSMEHYTTSLGFEVEQEAPSSEGVYWCQVTRGGASLMLQQHDRSQPFVTPPAPMMHLYFVCDDVDQIYEEFRAKGLDVKPPVDAYYGWRQLRIPDPDGYGITFESPIR